MDALDQVLKGKSGMGFSKRTKLIIIESVEKIAENVEKDLYDLAKMKTSRTLDRVKAKTPANNADAASVKARTTSLKGKA